MNVDAWSPRQRFIAKFALDWFVGMMSLTLAAELQYSGSLTSTLRHFLFVGAPVVALYKVLIVYLARGHRRIWKYTSLQEILSVAIWSSIAQMGLVIAIRLSSVHVPVSLFLIDLALYMLGLAALRIARRLQVQPWGVRQSNGGIPTLVVGAGDTANSILADLERRPDVGLRVVGLIDDDPSKLGLQLRGHAILGTTAQMEGVIRREQVRHVLIAIPSADRIVLRGLVARARALGLRVQVVQTVDSLVGAGRGTSGQASPTLDDLRDSVEVKQTLLPGLGRGAKPEVVLVTGGAGYIGCHLVRKLLERGHRVRVLDNLTYGKRGLESLLRHDNLEFVDGDISSIRSVVSAVKDASTVIALAAIVGDPACGLDAEETLNLNYESTKILLEACNFYGVRRLVFASSCSVYGASDNQVLTESSPLNPVSLYARTRIMSEEVLMDRAGDVDPVILRLATVFGLSPRMRFDLAVNAFTARATVDRRIQVFGGDQWRPFVHCQDVAEAFLLAATAPSDRVRRETFNVGSTSVNHTISEVATLTAKVVGERIGAPVEITSVNTPDDLRNYRVSFDKIRSRLGFEPGMTLSAGIMEMADAILQWPHLRDYAEPEYSNVKFLKERLGSVETGV